jgi:bifunctional non-homologous end joining protein LigD
MASTGPRRASPLKALEPDSRTKLVREDFPEWIAPMKATLTDEYFSDPDWLFERKLDGVRVIAYKHGKDVRIYSRNRILQNENYPEVVDSLLLQPVRDMVLDGEVVAFAGKRDSFERLQDRIGLHDRAEALASGVDIDYFVFDVLHVNGYSTRRLPLLDRKLLLKSMLVFDKTTRFNDHRAEHGQKFLTAACSAGWEGLIAKAGRSIYEPGERSDSWLKFKCSRAQEFVIGGWTEPQGERIAFGSLLIGYYAGGELRYAGKVGTGFDTKELLRLHELLKQREVKAQPFSSGDRIREKYAHWARPELVCQVAFTEWTGEGKLRHPRYLGLRDDKKARDVVKEEAAHAHAEH